MDSWVFFGLFAAFAFGCSAVAMKLATSNRFFGLDAGLAGVLSALGLAVVFLAYYFLFGNQANPLQANPVGLGVAVLVGILWGLGNLAVWIALSRGADIAKMTPLYNTNTLIAVILGIVLLHELPNAGNALKVLLGAILIIAGAILVSI